MADRLPSGSPQSPVTFGKYVLFGLIARGGMAEVYRARSKTGSPTEQLLAIKCMRPSLARESRFVEMFIREGKLAVILDHDAIVKTFEIGKIEGRYFIAMEYIGGKDLTQVLRRCQETNQRIPVPHACDHVYAVLTASREVVRAPVPNEASAAVDIAPVLLRALPLLNIDSRHSPPAQLQATSPLRI